MNGVKLTGLWKNESKDGESFLSGSLGGVRVLVFKNKYKKTDKDPDFNLFFAPKEEKERPAREAAGVDPELGF